MSIQQAIIDIAELSCGEPPEGWRTIATQDAWQVAFSAGLMSAIRRLDKEVERGD